MKTKITFQEQVFPLKDKLFRIAFRIVQDPSEAQDVVQEVFIKVWNQWESIEQYKSLEGWCVTLTRNLSIDKVRSKHRRTTSLEGVYHLPQTDKTPVQQTVLNDAVRKVRAMMNQLPEKQATVMQLRDIEEMTYQEIADAMNISLSDVKVNLFRARKTIREQLIKSESYGL